MRYSTELSELLGLSYRDHSYQSTHNFSSLRSYGLCAVLTIFWANLRFEIASHANRLGLSENPNEIEMVVWWRYLTQDCLTLYLSLTCMSHLVSSRTLVVSPRILSSLLSFKLLENSENERRPVKFRDNMRRKRTRLELWRLRNDGGGKGYAVLPNWSEN